MKRLIACIGITVSATALAMGQWADCPSCRPARETPRASGPAPVLYTAPAIRSTTYIPPQAIPQTVAVVRPDGESRLIWVVVDGVQVAAYNRETDRWHAYDAATRAWGPGQSPGKAVPR